MAGLSPKQREKVCELDLANGGRTMNQIAKWYWKGYFESKRRGIDLTDPRTCVENSACLLFPGGNKKVGIECPADIETMRRLGNWTGKTNDSEWHGVPADGLLIMGFGPNTITDKRMTGHMTLATGDFSCVRLMYWPRDDAKRSFLDKVLDRGRHIQEPGVMEVKIYDELDFAEHIDPIITEDLEEAEI